jgi:Zn-dependent M28 family amino/carboxypeptidase
MALLALLAIQLVIATIDFLRFGYTNAANDNGTGVAAVLASAEALWSEVPEGWSVEVLLTGAEEAGMIGAQKWVDRHLNELDRDNVYVVNIDTVGAGQLQFVEKTGTLTTLHYDNALVDLARNLAQTEPQFTKVQATAHRVADFDSVWFARAGIAALTLGAYDENGLMPYIHRPEDTLDKVDVAVVQSAVDFATALSKHVMKSL